MLFFYKLYNEIKYRFSTHYDSDISYFGEKYKNFLVEIPADYWCVKSHSYIYRTLKSHNSSKYGYWPEKLQSRPDNSFFLIPYIKTILSFFNKYRWAFLYGIGFSKLTVGGNVDISNLSSSIQNLICDRKLINLSYKNILLGDLIYDTFLRLNKSYTIDYNDPKLYEIVSYAIASVDYFYEFLPRKKIDCVILSYSTYVSHGVLARVAVNLGIFTIVDSSGLFYCKSLTINDFSQSVQWKDYKPLFDTCENKKNIIKSGETILLNRFSGATDKINSRRIKYSAYSSNKIFLDFSGKVDVIIFLHDFFDSPHVYENLLYDDFFKWVERSLSILVSKKKNVFVKPHPNAITLNRKVIDLLKIKFPSVHFINPLISNTYLFSLNPSLCVSAYGSVLAEVAYFNLIGLSAGSHPGMDFQYCLNPNSVHEYESFLNNIDCLPIISNARDKACAFTHYYYLCNKNLFTPFTDLSNRVFSSDSKFLNIY